MADCPHAMCLTADTCYMPEDTMPDQTADAAPYDAGDAPALSRPLPAHDYAQVLETNATRLAASVVDLTDQRDRQAAEITRLTTATASQAEQLRRNGTLLCRLRDLDEQRDRAWADHDTVGRDEPTGDERATTIAHAAQDIADQMARTEEQLEQATRDRDRADQLATRFAGRLADALGRLHPRGDGTWTGAIPGTDIARWKALLAEHADRSPATTER